MNKKCLILLPAIALLSFPSCNRTTILTFDSGAGCFYDDAVHRSYHINPGTKLSDLNIIPHPTAFHDEELFPDFMNVYGWADDKGLVDKDYIIGGNVTLTACYFPSLATAIEESNKILKQKYDEILLQVVEQPSIREKIENAYNKIIKNLNDAKNEFEVAAVFAIGNGDLNAISSVISSHPEKIDMLSIFMSQFFSMCFQAKNQLATIAGDVFGELCRGLAVSYDSGDQYHVNWYNSFFAHFKNLILEPSSENAVGVRHIFNAFIGAFKKVATDDSRISQLNALTDLYSEALSQCTSYDQSSAIGSIGANIASAFSQKSTEYFDILYKISKTLIDKILNREAIEI